MRFRAVVGREDHEGVLVDALGLQSRHEFADRCVNVGYVGEILRLVIAACGGTIVIHQVLRGGHRFVWLVKRHIHEERLGGAFRLLAIEPGQRFICHDLATKTFDRANRLAVADKPVIETRVAGLRLGGRIKLSVAVPFTRHAGGVVRLLEELREGDFGGP